MCSRDVLHSITWSLPTPDKTGTGEYPLTLTGDVSRALTDNWFETRILERAWTAGCDPRH